MSETALAQRRAAALASALAAVAEDPEALDELDAGSAQTLLAVATRAFAARREAGLVTEAFPAGAAQPTATDVVVTASAMLAGAEIELFELGLWQTWGGT